MQNKIKNSTSLVTGGAGFSGSYVVEELLFCQPKKIIIIDDSPNVWLTQSEKIIFLVPDEFRGAANDFGLEKIINELKHQ